MKIKCVHLEAKNLEILAKQIESLQNNSTLKSKGSLPFSNLPNGNVGVIMFFEDNNQGSKPREKEVKSEDKPKESGQASEKPLNKKLSSEKQRNLIIRLAKELGLTDVKTTKNWTSKQADMKIKELNKIKESWNQ